MKKRFLVVSPHPDDAELGLGGTIIKLVKQGHRVIIVDLTSGEPTPFGSEEKREKETQEASRALRVKERINLGLKNRLLFDDKESRLLLAEEIRKFAADILFCPYFEDAHPDHCASSKLTEAARFYAKFTKINIKGTPHYAGYLFYYFCTHLRTLPNFSFLSDITGEFKDKMKAVKSYRSQFEDNPKGRFVPGYIESQNSYLGKLINCGYAEALYCKEAVKINDLSSLL